MSRLVPIVVEADGRYERSFDIYSRLLRDRIVFLGTEVDDEVANTISAQLLFLAAERRRGGDETRQGEGKKNDGSLQGHVLSSDSSWRPGGRRRSS